MLAVGDKKLCSTCRVMKTPNDFYKNKIRRDGLYNACKACHREKARRYEKTESGKLTIKDKNKRMRTKYPEKMKARTQLMYAVKMGRIIRPEVCDRCGRACKPQGHHNDYSKPLVADWLCDPCHKLKHGRLSDKSLLLSPTN